MSVEKTFFPDFRYRHRNPYHDKLALFPGLVLRDHEAEEYRGRWNQDIFGRQGPLCAEIGSGYGHFMVDFATANPGVNFVGIDYRFKRSFNLAKRLSRHSLGNVRLLRARGERIDFQFGDNEVDKIFYFFPDPWPKKRHHKKRPFGQVFLEKLHRVLGPGGRVYIKTDHSDLIQWMLAVLEKSEFFKKEFLSHHLYLEYPDHFLCHFKTKFEKIFLSQGINIHALILKSTK